MSSGYWTVAVEGETEPLAPIDNGCLAFSQREAAETFVKNWNTQRRIQWEGKIYALPLPALTLEEASE